MTRLAMAIAVAAAVHMGSSRVARAQGNTPGVTATEIKIGNTMPYSGPASAYSLTGKTIAAYFDMINEKGGVNGRKLSMVSLDDAFSPAKTVEDTRRLVEGDGVAFMFASLGTQTSLSVSRYLNQKKVPQLFVISSSSQWNDPTGMPWSMALPWAPSFFAEAGMDIQHARAAMPGARFAVLYQNDDAGKDYMRGVREALGTGADSALALALPFDVAEPTIDSQMVSLADTHADVFLIYSLTPRACIQALRQAAQTGWRPVSYVSSSCANKEQIMAPAGPDASTGVLSLSAVRPFSPDTANDPAMADYVAFIHDRMSDINPDNLSTLYGYTVAQALVALLAECKDDLTRANIMAKAANMKDIHLPMLLPDVALNTSPTDYRPIKGGYVIRFDGQNWKVASGLLKGR